MDLSNLEQAAEEAGKEALRDLTLSTQAHIIEEVQKKLHSTRKKYLENLHVDQVDDDTWAVVLDPPAMWIEEGMDEHEMIDDLLKSDKARTTKKGSKVLSVPFEHKKGPSESTPAQKDLTNTVKKEMKQRGIPYGGLEMDDSGKPKQGLLHSFDVMSAPVHKGPNQFAVGQGAGPIGQVRQGPTGIPFLQGVRVYQKPVKMKDGGEKVVKSIVTFRTVSSTMKGSGRWYYPGIEAKNFFEEAAEWAQKEFEERIKDRIVVTVAKKL